MKKTNPIALAVLGAITMQTHPLSAEEKSANPAPAAMETPSAPASAPITETPTYLKKANPSETAGATRALENFPRETNDQRDARMAWWRDARFGMFIHWGVFSVPAGVYKGETFPGPSEYLMGNAKIPVSEYREFAKGFTASNYDADAIVRLAK